MYACIHSSLLINEWFKTLMIEYQQLLDLEHLHGNRTIKIPGPVPLLYFSPFNTSACAFMSAILTFVIIYISLLAALSDKQRQSDQGWSYANSYNRSTNSFCNNSSPSGEEWPSPPTQQHCTLSTAGSGNNYAQEVKSSDTEE